MAKNIIIGVGSGRCGTVSLSRMLQSVDVDCSHEMRGYDDFLSIVGWNNPWEAERSVEAMLDREADIVGDVAMWWLPHIPMLRRRFGDRIRFVGLKRTEHDCVESWMRKLGDDVEGGCESGGGPNPWVKQNPMPSAWDIAFPKVDGEPGNKRRSCRLYLQYYYSLCHQFGVPCYDMECLNDGVRIQFILGQVGLRGRQPRIGIKENVLA